MNLIIKQNNQTVERVPSGLIDLLYNLAKDDTSNGGGGASIATIPNDGLQGRIDATVAYQDAVDYLNERFGPNFIVSALSYYIRFTDEGDIVRQVLLANGIGDGTGVTTEDANVSLGTIFVGNSQITSFYELKYFKSAILSHCTNLCGIDISEVSGLSRLTKLPSFNGCPNLERFNGPSSPSGVIDMGRNITSFETNSGGYSGEYRWTNAPTIEKMIVRQPLSLPTNSMWQHTIQNMDIVPYEDSEYYGNPEAIWWEIAKNGGTNVSYFGSAKNGTNPKLYFDGVLVTSLTVPQDVNIINVYLFRNDKDLVSIAFHDGITQINQNAFSGCSNLVIEDLSLPYLTRLENRAFANTKLKRISNLGLISTIDTSTFSECTLLTDVVIPNTVTSIGGSAFYNCTLLANITIPESVTSIGANAFYGTAWYATKSDAIIVNNKILYKYKGNVGGSYSIPSGIVSVSTDCFRDDSSLTGVTIPSSVTTLGESVFRGTGLTSIVIPSTVTSMGKDLFYGCSSLTSATISEGITEIPQGIFIGCPLTEIDLPTTVNKINIYLVKVDTTTISPLQKLILRNPNQVVTIGATTLMGVSSTCQIQVPSSLVNSYKAAQYWSDFASQIQAIPT